MPVPPNLPINHQDDAGEFIRATDINDLANGVNSHETSIVSHTASIGSLTLSRTTDESNIGALLTAVALLVPHSEVSVLTYGADPTGTADSTTAFNNAFAALPSTGGVVYAPAGNYKINGIIVMGNGSASGVSTRHGMRLIGAAPPGDLSIAGYPTTGATRLFSGAASDMIHVNGPVQGWGLENIHLDGASVGLNGLVATAAQGGDCKNVAITGFRAFGQLCQSRPKTGALASISPDTAHNSYRNFHVVVPNVVNAIAIVATGANETPSAATSGTNYDQWDHLSVVFQAASGTLTMGLYLQVCGGLTFRHVQFVSTGSWTLVQAVKFDYSVLGATAYPADCTIEDVDFGTSTAVVQNAGSPAQAWPNKILNIHTRNTKPVNPNLPNLAWGYSNASP
jgi:Pectate lyase superfamily protein